MEIQGMKCNMNIIENDPSHKIVIDSVIGIMNQENKFRCQLLLNIFHVVFIRLTLCMHSSRLEQSRL